jgi:hypothetical protein
MTNRAGSLVKWSARILGIAVVLFIGAFSLDALNEGFVALLIHLVPALVLLVAVAFACRWEWIGAAVFIGLASYYAGIAGRLDWILVISGPLVVAGILYLLSWRRRLATVRL